MALSLRSVKRSRVSYDDTDPVGSDALVSAAMGMFSASEHQGLYQDACQLADIMLWGKGERGPSGDGFRYALATFGISTTEVNTDETYGTVFRQIFESSPVIEMFETNTNEWKDDRGNVTVTKKRDGGIVVAIAGVPELPLEENDDFTNYRHPLEKGQACTFVRLLPPVALKHLGTTYIFDAPCVFTRTEGTVNELKSGLKCSSLGKQSPVMIFSGKPPKKHGRWPLMPYWSRLWGTADMYDYAFCYESTDWKVNLYETETGAGRAFVSSWTESERRDEPVDIQILWGATSADFWDRTLNVPTPWGERNLGSLNADEGVSGSLLEMGASLADNVGLGLGEAIVSESGMDDADDDESSHFELVSLTSLRFMRDTSVAYPSTIISFDGGSDGWALEMFDSVAVNALELAYFLLSAHFQL